jgi:hypothetical protein
VEPGSATCGFQMALWCCSGRPRPGNLSADSTGPWHGRTPTRTLILMLINGRQIHIVHATTGQIIRQLILNPAVDYQARGITPADPALRVRGVAYVPRHHKVSPTELEPALPL